MTAQIIDGWSIAQAFRQDIAEEVKEFTENKGFSPKLAVIQVGDHAASSLYVRNKQLACAEVGIESVLYKLDAETSEDDLRHLILTLNQDEHTHGILLQMPLPKHLNANEFLEFIAPQKDVDGLHPMNTGLLQQGREGLVPCTPQGCLYLIRSVLPELKGKTATVVGRSVLVGRPLAALLTNADVTVTLAHSQTQNLAEVCRQADILVAAVGVPKLIQKDWVKKGSVVIDVGINRVDGKLCGDVDFEEVRTVAGYLTPVPKGVGPMTVACLLKNTLKAALLQHPESLGLDLLSL